LTRNRLSEFREMARRFGTEIELREIVNFREAIRDAPASNYQLVKNTFSRCAEAHQWSNHVLYRHRIYRCSRVHTLDSYLTETGVEHDPFTRSDGVWLDGRPTLRDELFAYLTSPTPLGACNFCYGTSGKLSGHTQLTPEEVRSRLIARTLDEDAG